MGNIDNMAGVGFEVEAAKSIVGTIAVTATAAGTTAADAFALAADATIFTTVASGAGTIIPATLPVGSELRIYNAGAYALNIYPPTGGYINKGSINAAASLAAGEGCLITRLSSTKFGAAGISDLTATEQEYLDGVTAGTVTASKAVVVDANKDISSFRNVTVTGNLTRASRKIVVPVCGNAKVGATAGWVITGGTNIAHATLPASQTSSTLVIPLSCLCVGDTLTGVAAVGQVESAGNNVTLTMSVRKLTSAAADNTDAELGTDNVGTLTADTVLSSANLGVTGLTEVLAENESLYVLLTGTTAASTDIDLMSLVVTVDQA